MSLRFVRLALMLLLLAISAFPTNQPATASALHPSQSNSAAKLINPAEAAHLLKDINTQTNLEQFGSFPANFFTASGFTYFIAQIDGSGRELWRTDGSAAGTLLLKDIVPGPADSALTYFANLNDTLYFTDGAASASQQLWKSDGTTAGTQPALTIQAKLPNGSIAGLINFNGALFITVYMASTGIYELWRSDGTSAGTSRITQIGKQLSIFTQVGSTLFFVGADAATGAEVWKTDGTAAGTGLVKDIMPGPNSSFPEHLTNVNGTLFFVAEGPGKRAVWKSDGNAIGTIPVSPDGLSFTNAELVAVNSTLFFSAVRQTEFSSIRGIWKSDGTAAGTVVVKEIAPAFEGESATYQMMSSNNTLFFVARESATGAELWKSNGTAAGTTLVKDINPGAADSRPTSLLDLNGTLFFGANNSSAIGQLWKSNGTAAGTTLLKDIDPDAQSTFAQIQPQFTDVNGTLFFLGDDGVGNRGLWKSDGTPAGTVLVRNFPVVYPFDPHPDQLTAANGLLFFIASDPTFGRELWKSDGTPGGTAMVKNVFTDDMFSSTIYISGAAKGTLFFAANDGTHSLELMRSDGTAAGTTLVKDINPSGESDPRDIHTAGNTIFFTANDGVHGRELWKTDGTPAGTVMVKDILPGAAGSFDAVEPQFTDLNGTLLFVANDGVAGNELWRSDGTAAGTQLVKDITPGSTGNFELIGPQPLPFSKLGNQIFFPGNDSVHGQELWESDGSAAGTMLVKDITPGGASANPGQFVLLGGEIWFSAARARWKTDGTTAGTVPIVGSFPADFLQISGITPIGQTGQALLSAYSSATGIELWQTDGTLAATVLLQDIATGPASSNPSQIQAVGANVFFLADDNQHGNELWAMPLAAIAPASPRVAISGPASAKIRASATFVASISPITDQLPVTYAWQATGQAPITHTGGPADRAAFTWDAPGTQTITVTASNAHGIIATDTLTMVSVQGVQSAPGAGNSRLALPMVRR